MDITDMIGNLLQYFYLVNCLDLKKIHGCCCFSIIIPGPELLFIYSFAHIVVCFLASISPLRPIEIAAQVKPDTNYQEVCLFTNNIRYFLMLSCSVVFFVVFAADDALKISQ
jgi:hypothetical protein